MGKRKRYSEEFKRSAVARVLGGEPYGVVARQSGASTHSLRDGVKAAEASSRERPATRAELEEIRELKCELRRVKEDNEILKKAVLDSTGPSNGYELGAADDQEPEASEECVFSHRTQRTVAAVESRR